MQDTELFLELAGIAGVFVGFGALIAVRSGGASDAFEVAYVRGVVFMGLIAVAAALTPVTLARYDLGEHLVLALSSAVVAVGLVGMFAISSRTPEWTAADKGLVWPRWFLLASYGMFAAWLLAMLLIPVVIVLGLAPDIEAALYVTDVVLIVFWTAVLLLQLVFRTRTPAVPDPSSVTS